MKKMAPNITTRPGETVNIYVRGNARRPYLSVAVPHTGKLSGRRTLEEKLVLLERPSNYMRTRDEHNKVLARKGYRLATAGEVYAEWKALRQKSIDGTLNDSEKRAVQQYRTDIGESSIVLNTTLDYNRARVTITQHKDTPTCRTVTAPVCEPGHIDSKSIASLYRRYRVAYEVYLQAYFDTADTVNEIADTLTFIAGEEMEETRLLTPTLEERKENPRRVAVVQWGTYYRNNRTFDVSDDIIESGGLNYERGRARRVSMKAAAGGAKNKGKKRSGKR